MATPTAKDANDVGQIEHVIAQVRDDLGRTVQELGSRLTPAHLMDQAKRSLRDSTMEKTRAVAQSASDVAAGVAMRTRDVDALDAVVRQHNRGALASYTKYLEADAAVLETVASPHDNFTV